MNKYYLHNVSGVWISIAYINIVYINMDSNSIHKCLHFQIAQFGDSQNITNCIYYKYNNYIFGVILFVSFGFDIEYWKIPTNKFV